MPPLCDFGTLEDNSQFTPAVELAVALPEKSRRVSSATAQAVNGSADWTPPPPPPPGTLTPWDDEDRVPPAAREVYNKWRVAEYAHMLHSRHVVRAGGMMQAMSEQRRGAPVWSALLAFIHSLPTQLSA